MTTLFVAIFGAVGVLLRYRLGLLVTGGGTGIASSSSTYEFPYATLGINVSGTFLLSLLASWSGTGRLDPALSVGLTVGLLGGYTTFSSFGWETLSLVRDGKVISAVLYAVSSVGLGLGAAWLAWSVVGSG